MARVFGLSKIKQCLSDYSNFYFITCEVAIQTCEPESSPDYILSTKYKSHANAIKVHITNHKSVEVPHNEVEEKVN